jgi:hypothetical protein
MSGLLSLYCGVRADRCRFLSQVSHLELTTLQDTYTFSKTSNGFLAAAPHVEYTRGTTDQD